MRDGYWTGEWIWAEDEEAGVDGAEDEEAGVDGAAVGDCWLWVKLDDVVVKNRFFWVDERVFPTIVDWCTSAPKDEMPAENTYSPEAVMILNTHCTPIQKQPEALLCLVGLSRRYYLGDEVYPTFLHDDDRGGLICAPNPTKVKTGTRPRAAHKVPLLTITASRVIEMEDMAAATDSSREAVAPEVSPSENVTTTGVGHEACQAERIAATSPHVIKERRKRVRDGVDSNAPPKVLRRDHADSRSTQSTHGGKSLAAIGVRNGIHSPSSCFA
nr:hypothetical protein [Tanacetum cinerariifolium]